jgi:hypothetical protein
MQQSNDTQRIPNLFFMTVLIDPVLLLNFPQPFDIRRFYI